MAHQSFRNSDSDFLSVFKIMIAIFRCMVRFLHIDPPAKMVGLPNHAICRIVHHTLGEEGIRVMNTNSAKELKALRLSCRGLVEPVSGLMFSEAHLFLHHKSFARIMHFWTYVRKLVVWLPVFVFPEPNHHSWRYGSVVPSADQLSYIEELKFIWDLHRNFLLTVRILPRNTPDYIDPWDKLSFIVQ